MKHTLRALALALSLVPSLAAAQSAPATMPYHTVYGRLGATVGDTGPGQAIPFATFNAQLFNSLCQTNNAMPVYSTAQGRWICTPTQTANTVLAGPSTGAAAQGAYRALVGADLPLPAASTLGGVMSKAAVASNWLRSIGTDGIPTASQPSFADISGVATGAQLPNPSASTLGGVQSKVVVSHQFLNTISTAGVPGSAQPACADVSDASVYCNAARGQLPGETSTGSATAGNIGEVVTSIVLSGSAVVLTTSTPANITSISLTAGDWDVTCAGGFTIGGTTSVTVLQFGPSSTTATITNGAGNRFAFTQNAATMGTTQEYPTVGPVRFSLSGTTTIFLVASATFTVSTVSAYGKIYARRAR